MLTIIISIHHCQSSLPHLWNRPVNSITDEAAVDWMTTYGS